MVKKRLLVFMLSAHYARPILMKVEFSRQLIEKCSNIKFHKNPSSGSRVVQFGKTDRLS